MAPYCLTAINPSLRKLRDPEPDLKRGYFQPCEDLYDTSCIEPF